MRYCVVVDGFVVNVILGWREAGPDETVVQSDTAGIGWSYDGSTFSSPEVESQVPTHAAVDEERSRRLALGFSYDFGDSRGVHHIGATAADWAGWDEVTMLAQALINTGSGSMEISIDTDTGPVTITATEWQLILLAAGAHRQPIWLGSFALKAMDPIPADFATNDSYWA